jgi:[ribosomal protein S5]-alanine N-acetyltransferase
VVSSYIQPPVFTTSRLYLRPVAASDVPTVQQLFADYEIIRHLSREVPWPYPAAGARAFVCDVVLPAQGHDRWVWAICPADSPGRLIGMVDLWRPGRPEHRGFWLARHYWGRGLMSEALVPLTNWAFDGIGYQRLILANARGNLPSRRLKEKAGARLLRTEPGEFVDPSYTEREVWELTRDAWNRRRAADRTSPTA